MASKAFSYLPLHLVSHMLHELDSIQTLGSVILSHSTFYAAFKDNARSIIHGIIMSQMGFQTRTLYYAIAAYEASLVDSKNDTKVTNFIHDRFESLGQDVNFDFEAHTIHIKPEVAAALSKTQVFVNHFTKGFIHDALPRCLAQLDIRASENLLECSDRETFRIQRALYRYQTYCSLYFRNLDDLAESVCSAFDVDFEVIVARTPFFFSHSPWENEQLACLLDYLESVLSRSYDEVAKYDIAWGANEVMWLSEGTESRGKQAYLSLGLDFLHRLDHATDYLSRYQILTQNRYGDCALQPPGTSVGISVMLKKTRPFNPDEHDLFDSRDVILRELTPAQLQFLQPQGPLSIFDDVKSDPERIWYLAHYRYPYYSWQNITNNREARRCGYVMWDARRPHPAARDLAGKLRALRDITRNRLARISDESDTVRDSWRRRKLLYDGGARGRVETAMRDDDGKTQVSEIQSSQ